MKLQEQTWPRLEAKTKLGKTKYWVVSVYVEDSITWLETEYWQDTGQHQTARKKIQGKSIGKANETTPFQQAVLEAASEFKKQKDKGYREDGEESGTEYILPMLAHDFDKRSHNIIFPCWGQPKLDGFRCLFDSRQGFWSRQGKPFSKSVDLSHLHFDTHGFIVDGELILPPPYTFQETCKAVKKQRPTTPLLEFHIFDIVDPQPYSYRINHISRYKNILPSLARIVQTVLISNREEASEMLQEFLAAGYEGLILRNSAVGGYTPGQRSEHLQKFKEFTDAEFLVVDVVDGAGKEEGAAVFVCATASGQIFKARPTGTYEARKEQFQNKGEFIGKQMKVKYQNLTDDGIPRFPVAIAIREDFDK